MPMLSGPFIESQNVDPLPLRGFDSCPIWPPQMNASFSRLLTLTLALTPRTVPVGVCIT